MAICPKHGEYEAVEVTVAGITFTKGCPKCIAEGDAAARKAALAEKAIEWKRMLDQMLIGQRYGESSIANWKPSSANDQAIVTSLQAYVSTANNKQNLLMYGATGAGKTHLAIAVMREFWLKGVTVKYVTGAGLAAMHADIERGRIQGESLQGFFRKMGSVGLLVVDDFGVTTASGNDMSVFGNIVDLRYSAMLPTVIVSNLVGKDLAAMFDDRVKRRLFGDCLNLKFKDESNG